MSSTPIPPESSDDGDRTPNSERLLHDDVRFEPADIAASRVLAILFGIALVFVGVGLICLLVLNVNERGVDRSAQSSQYSEAKEPLPAAPRLEPLDRSEATATADVFAKQLAMERRLHSYGDTAEPGFVRIPIERAMKVVVASLPARQNGAEPPAKGFGLVGDGEPNSGRLYSEAPTWLREKK